MGKKPKRSRHRVPLQALEFKSDPIDERYAIEVERDTNRLQKAFEAAQLRLARASEKAERVAREAEAKRAEFESRLADTRKRAALQRALRPYLDKVEAARREQARFEMELQEIARLMMPGNYAGAAHRKKRAIHTSGAR